MMTDEEFDWRKNRKERKEIEEDYSEDDPDEQPAAQELIEMTGINPDELFAEEEDAEKTKNN